MGACSHPCLLQLPDPRGTGSWQRYRHLWVELEPYPPTLVHLKQELNALLPAPADIERLRKRMNPALRQRTEHEVVAA